MKTGVKGASAGTSRRLYACALVVAGGTTATDDAQRYEPRREFDRGSTREFLTQLLWAGDEEKFAEE